MKFECGDLDRALANADLMPEAREHLKTCAACRGEYRLWTEISASARELHSDWESPALWPNIRRVLEAERKPRLAWWQIWSASDWKMWAVAAALLVTAGLPLETWRHEKPSNGKTHEAASKNSDFLTEQALAEVEKSEAAYRLSIDKLSRLAAPKLKAANTPAVVNAKEKLLLLDSAIAETRSNVASNRFNVNLQQTLAGLYLEKQETLRGLVRPNAKN